MQKLWFGLFGLIITTGAFAADLCVKNDAMVVAFNKDVAPSSVWRSADDMPQQWSATYSYGTLSGICAWHSLVTPALREAPEEIEPELEAAFEKPELRVGSCYCKVLRPTNSRWVSFGNGNNYRVSCGYTIIWYLKDTNEHRGAMGALLRAINNTD